MQDHQDVQYNPIYEEDLSITVSDAKQHNCHNQKVKCSKLDDDTSKHKLAIGRDSHLKDYTTVKIKKDIVTHVW